LKPFLQHYHRSLRDPGAELEIVEQCPSEIAYLRHCIPEVQRNNSSDWDIAVTDARTVGAVLQQLYGRPLVTVSKRYVIQRYYQWGQVDLMPRFEWCGIFYLNSDRFWTRTIIGTDGLPRPCIAHDAFIAWMTGLLWGGSYRRRYDALIAAAVEEDPGELEFCLTSAFGERLGIYLMNLAKQRCCYSSTALVANVRAALWRRSLKKNLLSTLINQMRHWKTEAIHHLHPPFPWIALLGSDGTGKSTTASRLNTQLTTSRLNVIHLHWGPDVQRMPNPGELSAAVPEPHGKPPRGFLLSHLKLLWLFFRWTAARWGRLGHARAKNSIWVSDRYYIDLLVDPMRYRYGGSLKLASLIFRIFPKPDCVLVLVGDPERIHKRKPEVTLPELYRQMAAYHRLPSRVGPSAHLINCEEPPSAVVSQCLQAAFSSSSRHAAGFTT
jgi:thymidylate kinase